MPPYPAAPPGAVDLAVLDIAGTTVQEHGAVYTALAGAVRAAAGGPVGQEELDGWMGGDKTEAITALLTAAEGEAPQCARVAEVLDDFRRRLAAAYAERAPTPVPGVEDAIAALRRRGIPVVLTTGFDRQVTRELLASLHWSEGVVDAVVTAEEVGAGRPAPYMVFEAMRRTGRRDVARVLVAGDTERDLEAGSSAGAAYVVGVLTGGRSAQQLGRVRHTHLLASASEIPDLLG